MDRIIILDTQGNERVMGPEHFNAQLEKLAREQNEYNFQAGKIWDKAGKYLEIFLIGPQKQVAEQQFLELLANVCREEGFTKLAAILPGHFALPPISGQPAHPALRLELGRQAQEKMKKLFLPPAQNHVDIETLIVKIANHKSSAETAQQIGRLIREARFLPHQNTLKGPQAYECMQIVLEDNLNDIFDQLKQAAINFQNMISTNLDFSRIRQKMSIIKSTRGFSSGPVSFIKIYTSTFETLRQNLSNDFTPSQSFTLSIHHPDILEYLIFIKNFQKNTLNKHLRFIIEITPQFLEALLKDEDYELISPETEQTVNLLSAKNTFDLLASTIVENQQITIKQSKFSRSNFQVISGVVNLAAYAFSPDYRKELAADLKIIQEYLQKQQTELAKFHKNNIRLLINFTGWNDFLIHRKIVYNSLNAIQEATGLFTHLQAAVDQSTELSVSLHSPLLNLFEQSRGLECLDQLAQAKFNLDGQEVHQLHGILREYLTELGLASNETIRQIFEANSLNDLYQIPTSIRILFKTAREIDTQFHLEFQREMENILTGEIEKRIYFENPLELEKIKETLLNKLKIGIKSLGFFQFGALPKYQEETDGDNARNFLLTLNKNKKRRHREIQPPLFQIKKTEEIRLPPVSNQNN